MKSVLLSLLFFTLWLQCCTSQTSVQPQKVVAGQWIKSWLLCGPIPLQLQTDADKAWDHLKGYSTDYLIKFGGEAKPVIKAGDAVKTDKGSIKWKVYQSNDSIIDLVNAISKAAPVLAYAYSEVEADEPGLWMIGLGTNDGGSLFVNGLQIWDYPPSRGLKIDSDLIPVFLKKGKNTLLLKVEQHGSKWGFCLRFHPFSAEKAMERGELFNLSTAENGTASLTSKFSNDVLSDVVQKVQIEVADIQNKIVLKEERLSPFVNPLNLPSSNYQPYLATLKIMLKNGKQLDCKIGFNAGKRIEYLLFIGGKSAYRISLSPNASESEKWAAKELQHWLKEISGVEIPISTSDMSWSGPQIVIGYQPDITKITGSTEPLSLDESFRYFNSGPNIYIFGGKQRGTMYGVFSFLENELGCRWYSPKVSVIPKRDELKFTWYNHSEKPGVRVRNDFYYEAFEPIWAARNRVNGSMGFREQPGGIESYWGVHTFYPLMPPEEFFKKHPEYYSMIDGKRTYDRAQLCLSNPEVLKIMTERIKKRMVESPEYLIYDVSQNDWHNDCECDKCQAIVKKYGTESGIMIWFVNQVAEAVEKEFPDKFIGTLAYQYTRTPPKNIKPRNNVVVRLCSIECCFAHDFKSCPQNKSFIDDLQTWSSLAPHMYIWDYVVNFNNYIMPFPNFSVLQPNIKTLQENNAIGIMEQAAYQSRGGEFSELRSYLISKLLWNPEANTTEIINDFIYGYYGRSGKFVKQYFDLVQRLVTPQKHFQYGINAFDPIYSDAFVNQGCALFEEAEKVADNQEILQRVEVASLPILYLKCKRMPRLALQDGSYDKFTEVVKREGITHYAEAGVPHKVAFHNEMEHAR